VIQDTPLGPITVDPDNVLKRATFRAEEEYGNRLWAEVNPANRWAAPSDEDNTGSLADQLAQERTRPPQLVDGLLGAHHNLSVTAQYKTGKTTFGMNVMRALVDGVDLLGRKTHLTRDRAVMWWNTEMDRDDWEGYIRGMGIGAADRIMPRHLRGRTVPLLTERGREWTIENLRVNNVDVWFIDSWRVLCAWNGVHENDNSGGGQLTAAIDEIKQEAGVAACVILVHTGRAQFQEGEERSRGMTALDDWVDARWILTRQGRRRFFAAAGRGISWEGTGTALIFDEATGVITLGEGDRRTQRDTASLLFIHTTLTQRGPLTTGDLRDALHSSGIDGMTNTDNKSAAIAAALSSGVVTRTQRGSANVYAAARHPDESSAGLEWARTLRQ